MKEIINYINNIEDKIISYRRDFHRYPELGWTEFRTASIIAKRLLELGFEVKYGKEIFSEADRMGVPSAGILDSNYYRALKQGAPEEFMEQLKGGYTGVLGVLNLGEGPTVAMRFDIDAIGVSESTKENHLPFSLSFNSSNDGIMHSCGHDGHAAIGLGVAHTLANFRDRFKGLGTIKLIFQPAEEGVRGAKSMVKAGILDDVDYVLGNHIMADEENGTLICGTNGFMATSKLDVSFKGLPAHAGAAPNEGRNALLAACSAVLNLNSIPRHKDGASRINVGTLMSGSGRNVIPEEASMKLETRGQTTEINEYVKTYAERIIKHAAEMHEATYSISYSGEALVGNSSPGLIKRLARIGDSLGDFNCLIEESNKSIGSEDFTYMMDRVQKNGGQGIFFILGASLDKSQALGHHTSNFDIDEKVLVKSAKLFTLLTLDIEKNCRE
ncbi:aminobenzoyl-glutamate utilization protein A [Dethiosulfatibacter aminovorans DSM 17477]|uniref:Aminobenzoyl-glutamate utilization protein A n=1 Tax=Dethiosulfatibacter aminovorans DSM 17477 TaxID=1121476 RepID=A0A1M6C4A8_9FIRM|nr:amidohydrolase [Dethiosulfatibacter aminovorans]SHI55782.1 aminobenzoyl-glutamate utilization protein A [Dethiosulfatibacter aminovorans DSM 17477]